MEDIMPKLTDTQLVILASAAKRANGAVLPLPRKSKLQPEQVQNALATLLEKKLVAEVAGSQQEAAWRTDDDGQPIMLVITQAGLGAIAAATDKPETHGTTVARASKRRAHSAEAGRAGSRPRNSKHGRAPSPLRPHNISRSRRRQQAGQDHCPVAASFGSQSPGTDEGDGLAGSFGPRRHVGGPEEEARPHHRVG